MKETLEVTIELIELDDPPKQISVVTEVPLKDIDGVKYVPWSRAAHALLISDTTLTRWHNRGYYETPNGDQIPIDARQHSLSKRKFISAETLQRIAESMCSEYKS